MGEKLVSCSGRPSVLLSLRRHRYLPTSLVGDRNRTEMLNVFLKYGGRVGARADQLCHLAEQRAGELFESCEQAVGAVFGFIVADACFYCSALAEFLQSYGLVMCPDDVDGGEDVVPKMAWPRAAGWVIAHGANRSSPPSAAPLETGVLSGISKESGAVQEPAFPLPALVRWLWRRTRSSSTPCVTAAPTAAAWLVTDQDLAAAELVACGERHGGRSHPLVVGVEE